MFMPQQIAKIIFATTCLVAANNVPVIAAEKLDLERLKTWQPQTKNGNSSFAGIKLKNFATNYDQMSGIQLLAKAKTGDVEAQYIVATLYRRGEKGLAKDTQQQLYWFEQAATNNHAHAQYELGDIYLNGRITTKNLTKAIELLVKSAQAGDADGAERLGYAIENGLGVVKDNKLAVAWYEESVKKFDPKNEMMRAGALPRLVVNYFEGRLTAIDYAKAYKYADLLAQRPDDWFGHQYVGRMLENGLGAQKNENLALQHYLTAIANHYDQTNKHGDNLSLYLAGKMFADGRGTEKNLKTALTYFKLDETNPKSATEADMMVFLTEFPNVLAPKTPTVNIPAPETLFDPQKPVLNTSGKLKPLLQLPAPTDFTQMDIEQVNTLANNGDMLAQYYMAQQYSQGTGGLAKSRQHALRWFEEAAKQGNAHAQFKVAESYLNKNDNATGLPWLEKSVRGNDADGKTLYALLYEKGIAVEQNINTAIAWYEDAALQFKPKQDGDKYALPVVRLISMFYDGKHTAKNYAKVKKYATLLTQRTDDATGNLYMGLLYENGFGVEKDQARALAHYLESIKNNQDKNNERNANEALYLVAKMYEEGRGTPKNIATALKYYNQDWGDYRSANAAKRLNKLPKATPKPQSSSPTLSSDLKQRIATAQAQFTSLIGPKKQFSGNTFGLTTEQIIALAKAGEAMSQHTLGFYYTNNNFGLKEDREKSIYWFKLAADQGLATSQVSVGNYYGRHPEIANNLKIRTDWYLKAAKQDNTTAQEYMADAYKDGRGAPKDIARAIAWNRIAAAKFTPEDIGGATHAV